MSTSTHRIAVNADTYTNVSNGNLNCTLMCGTGDELRILVGPSDREPNPDTEDYVVLDGSRSNTITLTNLEGEADLWVRSERKDTDVCVVRGPSVLLVNWEMATVTVNLTVTSAAYTRVSNGENNLTLVINTGEAIRIVVGPAPLVNAANYIPMKGPGTSTARGSVFSIENLGTDDVWVRAENIDVGLNIIRGTAQVRIADATAQ